MFEKYESREDTRTENLFWVSPQGAKIALIVLHLVAALAIGIEFLQPFAEHADSVKRANSLEFPASYAIYGFTACVLLVLLGRFLRRLVMRKEDYYRGEQ